MKKLICCFIFSIMISAFLTACSCEHTYDSGKITKASTCSENGIKTYTCSKCNATKEESIPCIAHNYDEEITVKPTYDKVGTKTFTCSACGDSYTEELPKIKKTVEVRVTSKKNIPEDIYNYRFSDRVEFVFSVRNLTHRDIKGVSGYLTVSDLFGKEIILINCDFTGQKIKANQSITVDGLGIDINPYIDNHVKLYNEKFEDLKFEYTVEQIVYADGATENFE